MKDCTRRNHATGYTVQSGVHITQANTGTHAHTHTHTQTQTRTRKVREVGHGNGGADVFETIEKMITRKGKTSTVMKSVSRRAVGRRVGPRSSEPVCVALAIRRTRRGRAGHGSGDGAGGRAAAASPWLGRERGS